MFSVHLIYACVIYKVKCIRLKMLSYYSKTNFALQVLWHLITLSSFCLTMLGNQLLKHTSIIMFSYKSEKQTVLNFSHFSAILYVVFSHQNLMQYIFKAFSNYFPSIIPLYKVQQFCDSKYKFLISVSWVDLIKKTTVVNIHPFFCFLLKTCFSTQSKGFQIVCIF